MLQQPTTAQGRAGLARILAAPGQTLAAFDYDGTLAPIVDDPADAVAHAGAVAALAELSEKVALVAIVTGRPVEVAVALGGLRDVPGLEGLVVVGHYGLERWDAGTDRITRPDPPPEVAQLREELPGLLDALGLDDAEIEDKGLSLAVHVRRLPEPEAALASLTPALGEIAERLGLAAEPGRMVIELRPPGMDKGQALRVLLEESSAEAVLFAGDDLGDLAAFDEVDRGRDSGVPGLLVCSGSAEVTAVAERADVVVQGPAGVAAFVAALVADLASGSAAPT